MKKKHVKNVQRERDMLERKIYRIDILYKKNTQKQTHSHTQTEPAIERKTMTQWAPLKPLFVIIWHLFINYNEE